MARSTEFARRFQEVIRGQVQDEVAERLGISQAYVSRIARRGVRPSLEVLERFTSEYGLDLEEWRRLAGYVPEQSDEERMAAIAARAMEEVIRRTGLDAAAGAHRLVTGLQELNRRFGRPIPLDLSRGMQGSEGLSIAQAEALLSDLERQLEQGLI